MANENQQIVLDRTNPEVSRILFISEGRMIFSIEKGKVVVPQEIAEADEAAKAFWDAVQRFVPEGWIVKAP